MNAILSQASLDCLRRRQAIVETVRKFFQGDQPDWFASMTFRRAETTALIAVSTLRSWLSQVARHNSAHRFRLVLWSVEAQRRGTAHLHALLAGGRTASTGHCARCDPPLSSRPPSYRVWKESWYYHHGLARFLPYDVDLGAGGATYVCKYILSDECEDWGLWEAGEDF